MKIRIVDYIDFEQGMSSNGGHYFYVTEFTRVDGAWVRRETSSYEDAEWVTSVVTAAEVIEFIEYVLDHEDDVCNYHNDRRFELTVE